MAEKSGTPSKGIVLKNLQPQHARIALFDQEYGRLDVTLFPSLIIVGSQVSYRLVKGFDDFYHIKDLRLDEVPFALARFDILFLHHVLELCYYFIPIATGTSEIFDLLRFLYSSDKKWWGSSAIKRLFLLKLLMLIGYYAMPLALDTEMIKKLVTTSLEDDAIHELATIHKKAIDSWLRICLAEHPHIKKFKTVHFLTRE